MGARSTGALVANTAQLTMLALSAAIMVPGSIFGDFAMMLAADFLLFAANMVYVCSDFRSRALLFMLHIGIFLFWITRPLLSITAYASNSWEGTVQSTSFALRTIYLTMASIWFAAELYRLASGLKVRQQAGWVPATSRPGQGRGADVPASGDRPRRWHPHGIVLARDVRIVSAIRVVSFVVFVVCAVAALVAGVQAWSYMRGRLYTDYYVTDVSVYSSSSVASLAALAPYAMCAYLATMPRKRNALVVLVAWLVTTIPYLMVGTRGSFVSAILFILLYYILRQMTDTRERWFGRVEVLLLVVGIPLGVLLMGSINYLRSNQVSLATGALAQVADTLYKQGVTFKTLEFGYEVNPSVQALGFRFFSAGSLVYSITQGFIGQHLLGCELWPTYNSAGLALHGSWYAHTMSYYANPGYLTGSGYGSAYVLELFADFGYVGIVLGSMLLAVIFCALSKGFGRSWFLSVVTLMAGRQAYYLPRGEFLQWASFLWSTRFWATIIVILLLALVLRRLAYGARLPRPLGAMLASAADVHGAPGGATHGGGRPDATPVPAAQTRPSGKRGRHVRGGPCRIPVLAEGDPPCGGAASGPVSMTNARRDPHGPAKATVGGCTDV